MRIIKALLVLSSILSLTPGALATQMDAKAAADCVLGWLALDSSPFGERLGNRVRNVETFTDGTGAALYHVVYLIGSGFVVVAAEDRVEPIIAFATSGRFDPAPTNPLGAIVTRDVPVRVARARATATVSVKPQIPSKWRRLQESAQSGGAHTMGITDNLISDLRVAPVVQTRWNQNTNADGLACFNFFTPPHEASNTNNYLCGCVATAMAQVIYYFKYPSFGVGTSPSVISVNGVPMMRHLRGGDGTGGPYAWNDMSLGPDITSLQQREAVGALTHDAGVAVHMQYSAIESSAYMDDAKIALGNTFGFNNAVIAAAPSLNVGTDFVSMINPNLDARIPVLLGVNNAFDGHAIVCDGYGDSYSTLYHHLNLGWGGTSDAWYALPIIDLNDDPPMFLILNACVYNIFPAESGEIISGRVLDSGGTVCSNVTIIATRGEGGSFTATTDNKGIYALVGLPSSSTYELTITKDGYYPLTNYYSTGHSADYAQVCGNIWGANITLIAATGPPLIALQPQSQMVGQGTTTTFDVTVKGKLPMTYQWQCGDGVSWTNQEESPLFKGCATAELAVNAAVTNMNGMFLRCIIANSLGSATSAPPAKLTVLSADQTSFAAFTSVAGLPTMAGNTDGSSDTATFNHPYGVSIDSSNHIFVADMYNCTIRKIESSGTTWTVSTIAGLAGRHGSADGVGATARFDAPYGVAVDGTGNVYVADAANCTIRKLTLTGTNWVVRTIAGLAGIPGNSDGIGTDARFRFPSSLGVDGQGNVFVADRGNSIIRKLTPMAGGAWLSSTIAGTAGSSGDANGTNSGARFDAPTGIAVDANDNLFVADTGTSTIRKITPLGRNWVVSTIGGSPYLQGNLDGMGLDARFRRPTGIALDSQGNLYVADCGNNSIRSLRLVVKDWSVRTIAGPAGENGLTQSIPFNSPFSVAVDGNANLFVADTANNMIRAARPSTDFPKPLVLTQSKWNGLQLTWKTVNGRVYQVQFKTNPNQANWIDLTRVAATGESTTLSVPLGSASQGFYRVLRVD